MIIKPTIQNRSGGPLNMPTSMDVRVQASDQWWINNPGMDARFAVEQIMAQRQGDVMQFVYGSRQMSVLGGSNYQRNYRDWGDLRADFSFNGGMEMLRLVVLPENAPTYSGGSSQSVGGEFKIDIPFNGFPVPGMGSSGGNTYPSDFKWWGPTYPFDFCQVPCDPGHTSMYNQTTKSYSASAPGNDPDLACTSRLATLTQITPISAPVKCLPSGDALLAGDPSSSSGGYTQSEYCAGVGGAAILTTPLSGLQYWEIQIGVLPSRVIADYSLPITGNPFAYVDQSGIFGTAVSYPYSEWGSRDQRFAFPFIKSINDWNTVDITWPADVDTWGTPSIGVVPAYYLPVDLRGAAATDTPKAYLDYTRVPGLDLMMSDIASPLTPARSITAISTAISKPASNSGPVAQPGVWDVGVVQGFQLEAFWLVEQDPAMLAPNDPTITDNKVYYQALQTWAAGGCVGSKPTTASTAYASTTGVCWWGIGSDNPYSYTSVAGYPLTPLPTPPTQPWEYGSTSGAAGLLYVCVTTGGGTADAQGPTGGGDPLSIGYEVSHTSWEGIDWYVLRDGSNCTNGYVTESDPYGDHRGTVRYTPGIRYTDVTGGASNGQHALGVVGSFVQPLTATVQISQSTVSGSDLINQVTLGAFTQLVTPGKHMPVYIGRMDLLPETFTSLTTKSLGDGSHTDLHDTTGNVGLYTGVDLGMLSTGDTVMVATDADNGYVWFGKNGKWYIPDTSGQGAVCTQVDAAMSNPPHGPNAKNPDGWAAVMDGYKKSASYDMNKAPPAYFPAVGYRIGDFKASMIYDKGKLKYAPPAGFGVYGQVKVG